MAEEAQVVPDQTQTAPAPSPFASTAWEEQKPEPAAVIPDKKEEPIIPATTTVVPKTDEEILDQKDWLKREFDVEDISIIKQEREELKKLRETAQTPAEVKYANDQSKIFHEALIAGDEDKVYSLLHEKKRLEKLTGSDVTKLSAEEIVKYSISQKNKDLTSEEIDFLYNKRFSFPSKPVKELTDTDDDYSDKVKLWEGQVQEKERELIIEAKMARPELEKLKTALVYQEIQKSVDPKLAETQQKELERIGELRNQYLQRLNSDYKNFNGYELAYKDEEVEIPVSFVVSEDEKAALRQELESFNVEDFIDKRWFDKEGNPNITQMMDDITLLRNKEKVLQKAINEVGSKMKEHYIKLKGNINVDGGQQTAFQPKQQNGGGKSPFAKDAWSETPPAVINN
jgi:hypothetical protein